MLRSGGRRSGERRKFAGVYRAYSRLASVQILPELGGFQICDVMGNIVAAARHARQGIGLDLGKRGGIGVMSSAFFKRAGSQMAVQTFTIVEWLVELDTLRRRRSAEIIDVHMP